MQPVYITGIGILSRLGHGYRKHKQVFEDCKDTSFNWDNDGLFPHYHESIPDFDPKKYIHNKKSIKFMSRQCMLGCSASSLAAEDAGIDKEEAERNAYDTALVFGTSVCDSILPLKEAIKVCLRDDGSIDYSKLANRGILNLPPLWILTSLPNTTAGQIAIQHAIRGVNFSLVNGPTGGLSAIGEAFRIIRTNRANRAFCGGSEGGVYPDYINRLAHDGIVDKTAERPACYSVGAKGGLLGEGAAVVTIENQDVLNTREHLPYAEISGYHNGYIPDFKDMEAEDISRFYSKCIKQALADAGIKEDMVSMVQGSGFGYEKIDKAEAIAVSNLFGSSIPFTTSNGAFGFALGASGGMSLVSAILQMKSRCLIPISSATELYCENGLNYVREPKPDQSVDTVLINSFDYLGCMTAIIIKKIGT